jgi:hypothetical protein
VAAGFACCLGIVTTAGAGQTRAEAARAVVAAVRVAPPPSIDGKLGDEAWGRAEPATGFSQRDPDEGKPATERTEVRILYDDEAIYVGVRLFDSDVQAIARRLSSRDSGADADWVQIHLDPLHDHLTGAQFQVSAAGAQRDSIISNDTFTDTSWDAVWNSAVTVDDLGWSAELRIPLSQLRFSRDERQTWGINVSRYIRRRNETSWLELVARNESGLASRMAHLTGLDGISPKRRLELLPYAAARNEFVQPKRTGDPFNDGSRAFAAAGLDLKWGLTSTLTLDGTINPDFGQVEVDPAVVNLTAFETFFSEKRPFFIEGSQIFNNFGQGGSNNFININYNDPRLFHSRRIGRAPQLFPSADFVDQPFAATILGAAKLTGKTRNGWSIGLVEALTGREEASTRTGGVSGRFAVEPRTNYFIGRLQRDLGPRASVGVLTTAVMRDLDTPLMHSSLAARAFVVGGDGHLFLDNRRDWVITGKIAMSHVSGSTDVIGRLQQAPQRYYQRPDATHVRFEPSRTALRGFSGRVNLNRNNGNWQLNAALYGTSPGFEANDLGFMTQSDRFGGHATLFWRKTATDRFTRFRQFAGLGFWVQNFAGQVQSWGSLGYGTANFLNYWNVNGQVLWVGAGTEDRLTRGGPATRSPSGQNFSINLNTDSRKAISFNVNGNYNWGDSGSWSRSHGVSVNIKPLPSLTISMGPSLNESRSVAQYVRTVVDPTASGTFGSRYVFGTIDQTQLSMTTRVNMILSPRMSIQVFAQPLLAVGDYVDFKELRAPRTFDFITYGSPGTSLAFDAALQRYTADPDAAGAAGAFSFANPDFNFKSLRLNAVYRWELRPGSNLYAVWTRSQQDFANPGVFHPGRDAGALFKAPGDDVFMVKMAYWLSR